MWNSAYCRLRICKHFQSCCVGYKAMAAGKKIATYTSFHNPAHNAVVIHSTWSWNPRLLNPHTSEKSLENLPTTWTQTKAALSSNLVLMSRVGDLSRFCFNAICAYICNTVQTEITLYSFKFIQSKAQNWYKMLSSFSHNFISNIAKLNFFHIFVFSNNKSFIFKILKSCRSLGKKIWFFSPSGVKFKAILIAEPQKSSFTLSELWNAICMRKMWYMVE